MQHEPVYLSALGLVCAAGDSAQTVLAELKQPTGRGVASQNGFLSEGRTIHVAAVAGALPDTPDKLAHFHSRNSRLALAAARQIEGEVRQEIARVGADRVAVIMGSSTSGISVGEEAVAQLHRHGRLPEGFDFRRQEMGSVASFLARYFDVSGPAYTISTACSSGAQAMLSARRLLRTGLADAVLVGGADSLCRLTVGGFSALEALSRSVCNPFSANRDGTMIGEGAALFLMRREPSGIALLGGGSTSDAYSMNAPAPDGDGIARAMAAALADAGLAAGDIDYVQLHGTGTQHNDAMESRAMVRIFGDRQPAASSSKPQLGHTLGAAGALGAALGWICLSPLNREAILPPHLFDGVTAPELLYRSLVRAGDGIRPSARGLIMTNSSAFGGNNTSLILGRTA